MQSISENMEVKMDLEKEFSKAMKKEAFAKIVHKLEVEKQEIINNASKIEDTINELNNCTTCKGLHECANRLEGHVYYPNSYCGKVKFDYAPCKYQKRLEKAIKEKPSEEKLIENARMKDIDINDKNRIKVIKWIKNFYDKYTKTYIGKGLYLHGSFGGGKTYLISALFNELKLNKKANIEIIYFPEVLRSLKDDWDFYGSKMDYYKSVDLLLIDDIGAEKVTEWGRDEVLGTILQSRMNEGLPTFFTSNLTIEELEVHLQTTNSGVDKVKAKRIIERIRQLTEDIEMNSENRRN